MRYLTLSEVLELHRRVMDQSGGSDGVRDQTRDGHSTRVEGRELLELCIREWSHQVTRYPLRGVLKGSNPLAHSGEELRRSKS